MQVVCRRDGGLCPAQVGIVTQQTVLFGGINGLSQLSPSRQLYSLLMPNESLTAKEQFHSIVSLSVRNDTALWLGTSSGLYSFNPETKKCTRYTPLNEDYAVSQVVPVNDTLWLPTGSGMKLYNAASKKFVSVAPGQQAMILIPNGRFSSAIASLNDVTKAFVAA